MYLKYTLSGHLYISPDDDCQKTVDAMIATDYGEEFCLPWILAPNLSKG